VYDHWGHATAHWGHTPAPLNTPLSAPHSGVVHRCHDLRGATTAERLRGTEVWVPSSQHRGACAPLPAKGRAGSWVREGIAPSRCGGSGYYPRKFFENSDAKSCILVTTCCEISCFLKTTAKKLGGPIPRWSLPNVKVGGPVSPGPYGCCAYARLTYLLT